MPACGAILDLPEPSIGDPNGSMDGSVDTNDSQILVDGEPSDGMTAFKDGSTSPDGSSMDDAGPCGGSACVGGQCLGNVCMPAPLTTSVLNPSVITTDGAFLYVISNDATQITKVDPISGATSPIAVGQPCLTAIFASGGYVYFTNTAEGSSGGSVSRCSTTGCSAGLTTYGPTNSAAGAWGITADSTNVYYTDNRTKGMGGGIFQCPLIGCSSVATTISLGTPEVMHGDPTTHQLFWQNITEQLGVYQCSSASCTPSSGGELDIVDFALDGTSVYWLSKTSVYMRKYTAAPPSKQIVSNQINNVAVAVDAVAVYWLDQGSGTDGALRSCPIGKDCTSDLGDLKTLSNTNLKGAASVTTLSSAVYFTTTGDNTIWRMPE